MAAALLVVGCATTRQPLAGTGGSGLVAQPGHWPDHAAGSEALLACASPAEFVELQQGVDMPRLVAALDDWSAVRLGAMGPLVAGADVLARKRADFLVDAEERYRVPATEVFALYVVNAAHDDELRALLGLLAQDKQLHQTLGQMCNVRAELERRGLKLADFPERGERLGDVGRGLTRTGRDFLNGSQLSDGARKMDLDSKVAQLPPPYQDAFHQVEKALAEAHFAPGHAAVAASTS